ncbi:uncharacterized protein STEHIDRAFT_152441 [Stereum hirsutum FP-91666 SS1]|uniref:uncharacterized protein n=1 Tax=Stereum hirsutum (strain FP-91666) TaxID=721885 RepID=UPI000440C08E|nr:uncharacterized protein STEHIDRAFT_152441 [Stereum hirsutum FP-91666 SS1]EIM90739.1 hypothetical protein STEHIDRAFT_152441 [Stereum hirsutum FP-91666 SS1]
MNQARIRSGPIPVGSDSDATQSERKGKFRDMSTLDPRYLELLAAQARAKFSDKIDAIGKKYGAYEYIVSDDQLEVLDIVAPEGYTEYRDRKEMDRWASGDVGIGRAASALSSSALLRIVEGQLANAKAEWGQMRNDPQYLVNVIRQTAHNCVEALIPDRRTGEILDPEQLLKTPHFVSSKLRYAAHNLLLTVGDWSLIVNVLRDIEKLDEKVGRFGDRGKRGFFMAQVRQILDTHQQSLFKDFYLAAVTDVPFIRKNVTRDINHPGYGGAKLSHANDPDTASLYVMQPSLRGALFRMQFMDNIGKSSTEVVREIAHYMKSSTEQEKEIFTPRMNDAWFDLVKLCDLIAMLGEEGVDFLSIPHDVRYIKHAKGCELSTNIFADATIEKHVKSIDSLNSAVKMKKIWDEIDKISMKRNKTPIEKVVAFTEMKPSWTHRPLPPALPAPSPCPPAAEEKPDVKIEADAHEVRVEEPVAQPSEPYPKVDDTYVPPRPYTDQQHISSTETSTQPSTNLSKTHKVKTKGKAKPTPTAQPTSANKLSTDNSSATPLYIVKGKVYETLKQLLVHANRPMDWSELEYAITSLGFSKVPNSGSSRAFLPPSENDRVLYVHQPHQPGNASEEMSKVKVTRIGKQLKGMYGWSMAFFEVKE